MDDATPPAGTAPESGGRRMARPRAAQRADFIDLDACDLPDAGSEFETD